MSRGTVLVVEDDVNLLAGIRDILELEQYTILTASDGEEALQILESIDTPPDLIVSDIMMPRMDGIDFLMRVREFEKFISIPFIYLTAKGEKSDIQRGKRLGVDDYVVKPFNADDLLIAVKSRLDRSREVQRIHEGRQDELKKNILTILNHEFRTPLTFVVAYSDMLNDISPSESKDNSEMITFLEGVRSGADRLRRLVENFIMLVELEMGSAARTMEWRQRKIDNLEQIIRDAANQAIADHHNNHHLKLDIPDDIPGFVGDQEYLKIAFQHLVDNACKFSDPGNPIEISATSDNDQIVINFKDYGRGIPENELENIWDSFYQINRALYEDQGAGSGLAIIQGITKLHRGTTSVVSKQGEGSTFTIKIPLQKSNSNLPSNGKHT